MNNQRAKWTTIIINFVLAIGWRKKKNPPCQQVGLGNKLPSPYESHYWKKHRTENILFRLYFYHHWLQRVFKGRFPNRLLFCNYTLKPQECPEIQRWCEKLKKRKRKLEVKVTDQKFCQTAGLIGEMIVCTSVFYAYL